MSVYYGCKKMRKGYTSGDTETGIEIIDDGEYGCVEAKRGPACEDATDGGDKEDEGAVEPVDVLVPV
jgi:hypothetical protein